MSGAQPSPRDRNAELLELVADLEVIQRRILDLTNGQIDAVVHTSGMLSLLPAAQAALRRREAEQRAFAAERAAILDAIPAQIALLNETGQILVVNKRWLAFGCANGLAEDYSSIGKNYLEICESSQDDAGREIRAAAVEIRSVLDGRAKSFSMEYPCRVIDLCLVLRLIGPLFRQLVRGSLPFGQQLLLGHQPKLLGCPVGIALTLPDRIGALAHPLLPCLVHRSISSAIVRAISL